MDPTLKALFQKDKLLEKMAFIYILMDPSREEPFEMANSKAMEDLWIEQVTLHIKEIGLTTNLMAEENKFILMGQLIKANF